MSTKQSNTGLILRWTLPGLLIVGSVAATVLAWRYALDKRASVHEARQQRDHIPAVRSRQTALNAEIAKRALDIARIEAFIVTKEQLSQLVGEVESLGRETDVEVRIPTVEEKQLFNDQGAPVPATGPLVDIRLKMVAVGSPKKLLSFLHAVEHMQRLTYFESWRLDASEQAAHNQTNVLPTGTEAPALSEKALLTADLIVAVRAAEGGQTP